MFISSEKLKDLPTVKTERLVLRPMELDDCEKVVEWRNKDRIFKMSYQGEPFTLEKQMEWFLQTRDSRVDYILMFDGIPIGSFAFKPFDWDLGRSAEQSRYIGEDWALGKGYVKEASRAWTKLGFDLGLDAIFAVCRSDNGATNHINKRNGFEEVGRERHDGHEWIILCLKRRDYNLYNTGEGR